MSRVYHRQSRPRWPLRKIIEVVLGVVILVPLLGAGTIAVLHLTGLEDPHPLVRLVEVEGDSMEPTFHPGEQLLFVRKEWHEGSVVIADIGEPTAVVKRVWGTEGGKVIITGDNTETTASFRLPKDKIIATFFCRTRLKFAPPEIGKKPASP